ncbi:prolipoprotein diacylglyceryl transferase family protein [[Acholeplasma] multilocale]|uniref:prolipoprotein diacylglyceryl transferase family protein n=1 Tax=[Acholeplasma] multilocale TaxID=264638 RepID=UPI000687913E|nr:prolipoprotein diacylglyceryl transferase family protein [[Acholeplasma] multilocale]
MRLKTDIKWKQWLIFALIGLISVLPLLALIGLKTLNVDWEEWEGNWQMVQYGDIKADYGAFHLYAFTMTMGMAASIGYSAYKFWRRGIPIYELAWGVMVVIPTALFGASIFGKLNADGAGENAGGVGFWGLFAFWKAGMAIHGGVYVGTFFGIITFFFLGRKPKDSAWAYADAILPNVLLGQVIGRWGNFFNHEVMGAPVKVVAQGVSVNNIDWSVVESSGIHLPDWILRNTMAVANSETTINGVTYNQGDLVQMSPIFFYESMGLLLGWVLITFVLPNIGKWFGKKPWKVEPNKYSLDWGFTFKQFFMPWIKSSTKMSWRDAWDKAYVRHEDLEAKEQHIKKAALIAKSNDSYLVKRWKTGKSMNLANNPKGYTTTKAGVEAFAFFFVWNFVRFILELERPNDHLFIMFNKPLSLILIGGTAMIGVIGMLLSQFVIPNLVREPGYMYEKDYFALVKVSKTDKPSNIKNNKADVKLQKRLAKEEKARQKLERLEN